MNSSIVQLPQAQNAQATELLSAAFAADPVVNYFLPEDKTARQNALRVFADALLHFGHHYQHIYTTADLPKGVAIWLPPEASSFQGSQLWELLQSGLFKLPFYMRWDRLIQMIGFWGQEIQQQQQMKEPFWYLFLLGVSPDYQNQGIGGALLQPILERADRDRQFCMLETSTEGAVRFYQRQGFEIVHQRSLGKDLPYWTLHRAPKG